MKLLGVNFFVYIFVDSDKGGKVPKCSALCER